MIRSSPTSATLNCVGSAPSGRRSFTISSLAGSRITRRGAATTGGISTPAGTNPEASTCMLSTERGSHRSSPRPSLSVDPLETPRAVAVPPAMGWPTRSWSRKGTSRTSSTITSPRSPSAGIAAPWRARIEGDSRNASPRCRSRELMRSGVGWIRKCPSSSVWVVEPKADSESGDRIRTETFAPARGDPSSLRTSLPCRAGCGATSRRRSETGSCRRTPRALGISSPCEEDTTFQPPRGQRRPLQPGCRPATAKRPASSVSSTA